MYDEDEINLQVWKMRGNKEKVLIDKNKLLEFLEKEYKSCKHWYVKTCDSLSRGGMETVEIIIKKVNEMPVTVLKDDNK